jgi:hypothetical protein
MNLSLWVNFLVYGVVSCYTGEKSEHRCPRLVLQEVKDLRSRPG